MALTLGSSDYEMFDGSQPFVYTQVLPSGNVQTTVANAVGLGPVRREVPFGDGFVYQIEQEWWLPAAQLAGVVPAEGDFGTDAGGVEWWLMADIQLTASAIAGTGQVYRVTTRRNR